LPINARPFKYDSGYALLIFLFTLCGAWHAIKEHEGP
jgi:hypothetical protein